MTKHTSNNKKMERKIYVGDHDISATIAMLKKVIMLPLSGVKAVVCALIPTARTRIRYRTTLKGTSLSEPSATLASMQARLFAKKTVRGLMKSLNEFAETSSEMGSSLNEESNFACYICDKETDFDDTHLVRISRKMDDGTPVREVGFVCSECLVATNKRDWVDSLEKDIENFK